MSRVHADIEDLKALRQAVLLFARRQKDALDRAEGEIRETVSILEDAIERLNQEARVKACRLDKCEAQAAAAMMMRLPPPDCRFFLMDLEATVQRRDRLLRQGETALEAIARYREQTRQYAQRMEHLSLAIRFLDGRIVALETFHATQIASTGLALLSSGAPTAYTRAVRAMDYTVRHANQRMGAVAEQIAAHVLSKKFGLKELPFDQPKHGFDRVFSAPGIPLIVVEAKSSQDGKLRLGQTKKGEQYSPEWTESTLGKMADPESKQWSPTNERIAALARELGPENIPTIAVVTNPDSELIDVYMKAPGGEWNLLEGNIPFSEFADDRDSIANINGEKTMDNPFIDVVSPEHRIVMMKKRAKEKYEATVKQILEYLIEALPPKDRYRIDCSENTPQWEVRVCFFEAGTSPGLPNMYSYSRWMVEVELDSNGNPAGFRCFRSLTPIPQEKSARYDPGYKSGTARSVKCGLSAEELVSALKKLFSDA